MDDFTAKIQNKKIKVENALSELNNEILTSFTFLQCLKNHSTEIVRDLNSITTPAIYFKEFVDVNSFILKYLSLLTEINCKFEMLGISENRHNNSVSSSDSTSELISGVHDISFLQPDSSKPLLNADVEDKLEEPVVSDGSLLNDKCLAQTLMKNNSKDVEHELETVKNNNNSPISSIKLKSNLQANSDNLPCFATNFSPDIKINNRTLTVGKADKIISKGLSMDSTKSPTFNEVQTQQSGVNFLNTDIPVAEIVPRKIRECNNDSGTVNDFSSLQSPSERKQTIRDQGAPEENITKGDDIQPIEISRKVGNEYEIMIENIHSPSEFYICIKDAHVNLFLELLQKLKLISGIKREVSNTTNESRKIQLNKQLGSYALFYSKCDELWCRAKVIDWYLNYKDDIVQIFLLDYGEYKCVSINDLQSMPEYFKKFPAFVRRCHLYGIFPTDLDTDSETLSWERECTEEMKSLTETSKTLKIRIAPEDDFHPATSLPVWLFDQNNDCVNELLVKNKYAVYNSHLCSSSTKNETKDDFVTEKESLKHWNPMREDFQAYENSYDLDINDPATYIYGYVGKDYERVCRHFAKNGYCFKGAACKKEHKKLDHLGYTTDQEEVYKNAFNNLSVPPLNSLVRVQVTCILGVNNFCCILEDWMQSPEEENLQTLLKFMNKPENIQEMNKLPIPPSAGQIVIAQYFQDNSWYRAKILESQPEKDIYSVLYVDYGNIETVSLFQIRAIEARYLHLPFQAVHCYIFGITQNPQVPVKDAVSYLNSKISSGQINIEVVSKLPGEGVILLVHVFDQNGENIGFDLLAKNYAIPKEEIIISCDSESMPG